MIRSRVYPGPQHDMGSTRKKYSKQLGRKMLEKRERGVRGAGRLGEIPGTEKDRKRRLLWGHDEEDLLRHLHLSLVLFHSLPQLSRRLLGEERAISKEESFPVLIMPGSKAVDRIENPQSRSRVVRPVRERLLFRHERARGRPRKRVIGALALRALVGIVDESKTSKRGPGSFGRGGMVDVAEMRCVRRRQTVRLVSVEPSCPLFFFNSST